MNLPHSNVNRRIALLTDMLRGKKVSQLELALYDIDIDLKEIEYWREIARSRMKSDKPYNSKHLPTVTFNTKG